jgi:hypothetical protein
MNIYGVSKKAHTERISTAVSRVFFSAGDSPFRWYVLTSSFATSNCSRPKRYIKGKLNGSEPADLDELNARVGEEVAHISEETFRKVMQSFSTRVHPVNSTVWSSSEGHTYKK